jgi:DNA invertase Pin-like site-specific DNA recombinase
MVRNPDNHPWKRGTLQDGRAKLTPQERDEVRQRRDSGEDPKELAKEYGISRQTVKDY